MPLLLSMHFLTYGMLDFPSVTTACQSTDSFAASVNLLIILLPVLWAVIYSIQRWTQVFIYLNTRLKIVVSGK